MSTQDPGVDPTDPMGGGREPTEEEMRAAYEAEVKKIRVEQVLLEQVVTLINLGMRKTGLAPGTEDERDLSQVQLAIESIRVTLPLLDVVAPSQIGPIRDALSQLQMAFVRLGGTPGGAGAQEAGGAPQGPGEPGPGGPAGPGGGPPGTSGAPGGPGSGAPGAPGGTTPGSGPAQRSGRLWVPGQ